MKKALISTVVIIVTLFLVSNLHADELKRKITPSAIKVPEGYKVEAYAANLSVPTTSIFDGNDLIVAESGYHATAKPRILRIKPNGDVSIIVEKGLETPVTGLLMIQHTLYISHRGKVSKVVDGQLQDIVTGLPSFGDHQNNNIVLGPDGKIYMGQGTTTNSGVVGEDNYIFGWLDQSPKAHDIPCQDITLVGQSFTTDNPLPKEKRINGFPNGDSVQTGAYQSYGTQNKAGEVIKGQPKCSGSILRFNPDGSGLEAVAWGLRNPFGLEFDQSGQLWATYHGVDVRGSRPVFNDVDYLVKVTQGAWYGWPEYFNGKPVTDDTFHEPSKPKAEFLWLDHPALTQPFLTFPAHSGSNGLSISPSDTFGYKGQAFVAEYGTYTVPTGGLNIAPAGFRIVSVNLQTKEVTPFASNILPGPSYINQTGGLNRPSDVVFGPDSSMYITDWGATTIGLDGVKYVAGSGVIWRIYKNTQHALRPTGPVILSSAPLPFDQRVPQVRFTRQLFGYYLPESLVFLLPIVILLLLGILFIKRLRNGSHKK